MNTVMLTAGDIAVEELSRRVVAKADALSEELEPRFLNMTVIRDTIASTITDMLAAMNFREKADLVGSLPELAVAEVEMPMIHFTVDEYMTSAATKALTARLLPLRYQLSFDHYEGRILPIMQEAGALASELVKGPAIRCVKPDVLSEYLAGIGELIGAGSVPPDDVLDRLLRQGCDFFGLLAKCLENPEWGAPEGLTEDTVGYSGSEIRAWFNMVGDLQHLNLRQPQAFGEALAVEISELGPPERTYA